MWLYYRLTVSAIGAAAIVSVLGTLIGWALTGTFLWSTFVSLMLITVVPVGIVGVLVLVMANDLTRSEVNRKKHFSSLVATLFVAVSFCCVNLIGHRTPIPRYEFAHGWPSTYLKRDSNPDQPIKVGRWAFSETERYNINLADAVFNLVVATALTLSTFSYAQRLARRFDGPSQYRLRSLLATVSTLMTVMAMIKSGVLNWELLLYAPITFAIWCGWHEILVFATNILNWTTGIRELDGD